MSDACSDVQFERQRVELLPARTVLSTFARAADGNQGEGTDPVSALVTHIPVVSKVLADIGRGPGGPGGDSTGGIP